MKATEFIAVNSARNSMYHYLSKTYELELTSGQIEEMRKKNGPLVGIESLEVLKNKDLINGFDRLRRAIADMKNGRVDDVQVKLASEYAGIFLGIRDGVPHPSESAYLSASHLVFQEPRDQVMEVYRQVGLTKEKEFVEPEDHISAELGFMAYMAAQTAELFRTKKFSEARRYIDMQSEFLKAHLSRWVPKFCDDIMSAAEIDYYRGIALVTRGFVASDALLLKEMANELSSPSGGRSSARARRPRAKKP